MDHDMLFEAIKELRHELEQVDLAIRQIEALEQGRAVRGRPPKAVAAARAEGSTTKSRVRRQPRRRPKGGSGDNDG